ncbi:MAG: hypothetical protein AUK12_04050 [Candidatus Levybacteria bacterium CG2_30_37_29]|nr:MAG: hypothetical protein AUK12_04050 [Candidatus Levybacteria bacterium CG2_30_37_29]
MAQFEKAQDVKRKSDLAQIARALEVYYQDNGKYPASNSYKINITINGVLTALDWGSNQFSPYMDILPKDPSKSRTYVYYSPSGNQTYYLYASLERGIKDTQACSGGICASLSTNGIPTETCGGASSICNYGISSPNTSP